ncbi:MAG: hypothetical protein ABGY41_19065 [Candidatus Poribacteria bacterium]
MVSAALFLWQALAAHKAAALHAATHLVVQDIEHELAYRLDDYGLALSRMADRWEARKVPREAHGPATRGYVRDSHGDPAVACVDAAMTLQRVEALRS